MTFSVMWTVLPNGYAPGGTGTLQLSLMAAPRISDSRASLGNSPLLSWPSFAANLPDLFVQTKGSQELIPATKGPQEPDLALWQAMFSGSTKVITRGGQDLPPQITASPASFTAAHESLRLIRQAVAEQRQIDASGRVALAAGPNRALDIVRAIHPLDADPAARRRGETLQQEITRLRAAGDENAALAAPFAAYARALRSRPAGPKARAARPLGSVPPITSADFHQVLGLLLSHPHLAIAVGLRIELTIPAFEGPRSIRVVGPDGQPINGEKPLPQSFSRVEAIPARRRFTMAAGPGPNPEVAQGMLAVAGNPDYLVSTTDVVTQSLQLFAQSTAMASAAMRENGGVIDDSLPARKDLGITIARRDRPAAVVTPGLQRSATLHHTLTTASSQSQSLELFADDVTRGFRLDVSRGGGPFRSLMTRRVRTTIGTRTLDPVDDEGRIEAVTGVEQADENGIPQLTTGDEFASWDGWSIAVPRPGFKVDTDPDSAVHAAPVPTETMPGYGIRTEISAVPGSVERLRFGDSLAFRMRAVDLAGNSIEPDAIDPEQVLPPVRFLRSQGAPSPTVVLRRRYTEGESLHHLVVRSADGVQDGQTCERHLAPPNAPQALAERHGMFDRALGNNRGNQGVRDEMLAIARREAGSFLDPTVPGRNGLPVPAPGIAVVTNNPAAPPPVTLPIPRGQALPNGAYVIHDTDHPQLPYLADPIVAGVSLIGFPGTVGPVVAAYGGGDWPGVQPIRLLVRPTTKARPEQSAEVIDDGGRPALLLHVPPGFTGTVELSSSIRSSMLGQLDTAGVLPKVVTTGLLPELSPRQEITIVHAVRVPAAAPAIVGTVTPTAAAGAPSYTTTVPVTVDRATTAQVDIEATWREIDDPGVGDLVDGARTLRVGSALVERTGAASVSVPVKQLFGDSRHRRITLTPWATTRFREYYPPVPAGDRSLQRPAVAGTEVSIPNRSKPVPPVVHSVIPLFRWSRGIDLDGHRFSTRTPAGLRVYLQRRWLTTGQDELLGVVLHPATPATGVSFSRLETLVTKWGGDPLELVDDLAPTRVVEAQFGTSGIAAKETMTLTDARAGAAQALILGHRVQFDAARDLWFADIELAVTDEPWPFVRLGLVRYQPQSLTKALSISDVVTTDLAQLPPDRTVTYIREGATGIRVRVAGRKTENSAFTVRQERYMPDPFDPSTGLASDAGVGPAQGWTVSTGPTGNALRANLLLSFTGAGNPGPVLAEVEAGRVVVEETMQGLALLHDETASRVVFTDSVDRTDIPED